MIKTAEEIIREQFELETGKNWVTIPVSHGELGFASWEYQLWLENKVAQFTQPQKVDSGNVFIEREIKSYGLPKKTGKYIYKDKWGSFGECVYAYPPSTINESWDSKYPVSWLEPQSQGEGYSVEDMAIKFAEWIEKNNWITNSDKHERVSLRGLWYCIGNSPLQGNFTTKQLYQKFLHSLKQKEG